MKTSVNNTTSRILLAPVAILVMVLSGLLVSWDFGLLCAGMVVYLSPELMMIFSKRWRVLKAKADREEEERIRQLYEELDRKYKGVDLPDDLLRTPTEPFDNTGFVDINMMN